MSNFIKSIPKSLKELRVHVCQQGGAGGSGLRQFILASYPKIKSTHPDLKVLIREAQGVEPRVFARFDQGAESHAVMTDLSAAEVEKKVTELVSRG